MGALAAGLAPGGEAPGRAAGVALALRLAGRGPITGLALGGLGLGLARGLSEGRAGASGQASSGARADEASRRESGWPGGGRGRTDVTGRSGIYPASGPLPPGDAEIRTPAQLVRGQFDEQGNRSGRRRLRVDEPGGCPPRRRDATAE